MKCIIDGKCHLRDVIVCLSVRYEPVAMICGLPPLVRMTTRLSC